MNSYVHTSEGIKEFMDYIRMSGLVWDTFNEVEKLAYDPEAFWVMFRKVHSRTLCNLLEHPPVEKLPFLMCCGDAWQVAIAKWVLTHPTTNLFKGVENV